MKSINDLKDVVSEDAPATNTSNVAGADSGPHGKFAGSHIFRVNQNIYNQCLKGKKKHARWERYLDLDSDCGKSIRDYAYKYPRRPIIIQNQNDGHMVYLRHNRYGGGGARKKENKK